MLYYVLLYKLLVLKRLGHFRMESTDFRGARTVPVPGNREPNIQGTRTVPVPGSVDWFPRPELTVKLTGPALGSHYPQCTTRMTLFFSR